MLQPVRIVLVEPTHPGNVGAVARALKTMGLDQLVLVNPKKFPHIEATNRAAGADSVLQDALVVPDVATAVAPCTLVLGTSVRDREVTWPTLLPDAAAEQVLNHLSEGQAQAQVAILFGRESSGLTNDELALCQAQIRIPANPEYSSLNLASAVQIICYELRMRSLAATPEKAPSAGAQTPAQARRQPASQAQLRGHLAHLQETLEELDFVKAKAPDILLRKLARLYNKAELSVEEVQILRGILSAMQDWLRRS